MQDKRCPRCGEIKDVSEFNKNKSRKDGLSYKCKICSRAESVKYYQANPEKYRATTSKYREANSEKYRAITSKYREANSEKVKAANAKYREANSEKAKAANAKWRKANPEKIIYLRAKHILKRKIGETPPPELMDVKILINQIKKELCKTSKN
jgi:hypothetical protein